MQFTVMPRGTACPETVPAGSGRRKPAPLGKFWKEIRGGVYQVTRAVTADGEWFFELAADGTWDTGHLPTRTPVKGGFRSLWSCRTYAGSGRAATDLQKLQVTETEGAGS